MKKTLLNLAVIFVIGMLAFTSCEKDKNSNPGFEFIKDAGFTFENTSLAPGDSVKIGFKCTWNGTDALSTLKFSVNNQLVLTGTFDEGTQSFNYDGYIIKYATDEDIWVFELVDAKGSTSSLTLTLTKDLTQADVEDITGVILGAQDNIVEKPMYSIIEDATYSIAEGNADANIQAKIDFVCYSDVKNGTHLASPGANWASTNYETDFASWTTNNESFFILDSPFDIYDFGILTKTKIKTAYDDAETIDATVVKRKTKDMAADKIYLLKTYNGKYGAIKVNSVTTGTTGSVNFDIKIEK